MRPSSIIPLGQARTNAGTSLRAADHFARAGNPLQQAEKLSCAARSLQQALPGLTASEARTVACEIYTLRTQAFGLYKKGALLQAARELSQRALLYEQSHRLGIDPRPEPSASGLLQAALQARLESIDLIRQLPQPQSELAVQLGYAARTIRYLLDEQLTLDAHLLDQAISYRVEAAGLFATARHISQAYFEYKILAGLYMTKALTVPENYLKAGETADKALVFFRIGPVDDPKLSSFYSLAAAAYRHAAKHARGSVPSDLTLGATCLRKASEFDQLELKSREGQR